MLRQPAPAAQPDGNCLYRAVEDQLRLSDGGESANEGAVVPSHSELRRQAVAHMREHEDQFLPFFAQARLLEAQSFLARGRSSGFVPQDPPSAEGGLSAQHGKAA